MAQSLLSRYDAMRCTFVRQNGKEYVEKINDFIEEVVETISDQHISRQTSENSMQKAITFFGQPMPVLSDDSSPPNVTTVDSTALDDVKDEVAELRREVAALKREVLSLKKSQKEKTRKDKSKNSKQKENQKKIVDEVKRMEKTHQLSIHTLEKNLSKVRDFVNRNHKTQVTGASGDVAQPSGYGNLAVPAPSMSAATAMSSPQQPPKASVAQPSGYGNPAVPAPSMPAATAMSSPQQPIRRQKGKQKTSRPGPSTGMTESLDVDIELIEQGRVDCPPGTVITDIVTCRGHFVLLAMQNKGSRLSEIDVYDLVYWDDFEGSWNVWSKRSKAKLSVTVLEGDFCFAVSCGNSIEMAHIYWDKYSPPTTIYEHPHRDIDAITALSPTTLAAAVRSNLLLIDITGHVYKTISIGMDIPHRAWSGTAGMSRVKDKVLIAWDSCGDILQIIDLRTESFTYKTATRVYAGPIPRLSSDKFYMLSHTDRVGRPWPTLLINDTDPRGFPQSRRVSSVGGSVEDHILACSSTSEELFLLGSYIDEVKKMWSIPSIIGTSAEPFSKLLHVSVFEDEFYCVTNVGEALRYRIFLK